LQKRRQEREARAKYKQPVVLPAFAGKAQCGKEAFEGDLNFCFFCFKTKEVASAEMSRLSK
jgi:hypothetical protein